MHGLRGRNLQQCNGEDHNVHRQLCRWKVRLDGGVCVHFMRRWALPGLRGPVLVHGVRCGHVQRGDGTDRSVHGYVLNGQVFVIRGLELHRLRRRVLQRHRRQFCLHSLRRRVLSGSDRSGFLHCVRCGDKDFVRGHVLSPDGLHKLPRGALPGCDGEHLVPFLRGWLRVPKHGAYDF